jgi:hypothetical protein
MSFKPFGFTFNPPLTVPSPPVVNTPTVPTGPSVIPIGSSTGAIAGARSNAGLLIDQLNNLTAMSQYLQDVIVARTGKVAIEINPAADPLTTRALASIYGTDTPPSFVTVSMYDNILDAHFGALQLEMSVGNDSVIQPNPMQVADLATVVNTINDHLIASPSYSNWLPLQLASLKSDSIVFQSWVDGLSKYPAYYASQPLISNSLIPPPIQAASLDINTDLYTYQNDAVARFSQSYSNVYQSLASASPMEQQLSSVVSMFFKQPLSSMLQIVGTLTSLSGLAHKTGMASLQGDLINFSFARLASDVSGLLHSCDRLIALAISPAHTNFGSLTSVMSSAQQQSISKGIVATGPMAGMSKANSSVTGNTNATLSTPELGNVSEGVKQLAETLNWGKIKSTGALELYDKSFRQLIERRLTNQNDRQSVMDSQRSMDSLTGLSKGVVKEIQSGTLTANSTPKQQQDAINNILTSLQTGNNTTFIASGNQIIANPPDMPPVPDRVQSVLNRAKIVSVRGPIQS